MAKLFAMGAYVYQAALAFGLLMAVARLLAPAGYATYSLFIATTQVVAIAAFEWARFACSRFYPGPSDETERDQRRTLMVEAAGCTVACLLAGAVAIPFGLPPALSLVGGAVAAAQGASDLHLAVVRFARRFAVFSWLNVIRASFLAAGTLAGAFFTQAVVGAVGGLLAGYMAYAVVAWLADRRAYRAGGKARLSTVREHATYGGVSAGMSVLGLLSPLGLKLILTGALGRDAAAGILLALDLLQRPFLMVIAALQTVEYPDVVAAFDRKAPDFAAHLGRFYALMTTLCLVSAAALYVGLRPIAEIVVAPALREAFLLAAPLVTLFSMLRALTQNIATTPAHLKLDLKELATLAVVDCLSFNLLALAASRLFPGAALAIVAGATLGAALAGLYGLKIATSLPFALPRSPLLIGGLAMLLPAALFFAPTNAVAGIVLAGIAGGAVSLAAMLDLRIVWRRSAAEASS
jgi:O-antigen/teichoic acid export membrane protein